MNSNVAAKRIDEVIQKSAVSVSEADFLATHIPFDGLILKEGYGPDGGTKFDEQAIFGALFNEHGLNRHQTDIVLGDPGSGKSHFIRWIYTKLNADSEISSSNVICIIRRESNTLHGALSQLLQLKELKEISNGNAYRELLKADQTLVQEGEALDNIYHLFQDHLAHDDTTFQNYLSLGEKRSFDQLFRVYEFQKFMERDGGPFSRIKNKIFASKSMEVQNEDARFRGTDFLIDTVDFEKYEFDEMLRNFDRARKLVKDLNPDSPSENQKKLSNGIASILNSYIDIVIHKMTGIGEGSIRDIFREIRTYLHSQGKGLILLVEDINSLTGVSRDLLDALIVAHQSDGSDGLCRLISIIGSTTAYFEDFPDHFKDRITFTIEVGSNSIFRNKESMYIFFAKYLNAMSLTEEALEAWRKNGADDAELPVHTPTEKVKTDFASIEGRSFSLYPFSKKAIDRMTTEATEPILNPRKITTSIIQLLVRPLVERGPEFFLLGINEKNLDTPTLMFTKADGFLNQIEFNDKDRSVYRSRLLAFLTLYRTNNDLTLTSKSIAGIPRSLFDEFGLSAFEKEAQSEAPDETSSEQIAEALTEGKVAAKPLNSSDEIPQSNQNDYAKFLKILHAWEEGGIWNDWKFIKPAFAAIIEGVDLNWQIDGFPIWIAKKIYEGNRYSEIVIEDMAQKAIVGAITVKRKDDKTFLAPLGESYFLGKDGYQNKIPNAVEVNFLLTEWLLKNGPIIIQRSKEILGCPIPSLIAAYASILLLFEVSAGNLTNFDDLKKILFDRLQNVGEEYRKKHSVDLLAALDKNYSDVEEARSCFANSVVVFPPGKSVYDNSVNSVGYFDKYVFDSAIKTAAKNDCEVKIDDSKCISFVRDIKDKANEFRRRIYLCLDREIEHDLKNLENLSALVFDDSGHLKDDGAKDHLKDFLQDAEDMYSSFSKIADMPLINVEEGRGYCDDFKNNRARIVSYYLTLLAAKEEKSVLKKAKLVASVDSSFIDRLSEFVTKKLQSDLGIIENSSNAKLNELKKGGKGMDVEDVSEMMDQTTNKIADALKEIGREVKCHPFGAE